MLLTEYNPKKHIKMERKEAHEEGWKEGIQEERVRAIIKMRKRGDSYQEIADFYEISVEEVKKFENHR